MKLASHHSSGLLRSAILVLLLLAQGVATAHQFEHWDQPAQELCASCALSSGLDAPVTPATGTLATPEQTEFIYCYNSLNLQTVSQGPYHQRAPPVSR